MGKAKRTTGRPHSQAPNAPRPSPPPDAEKFAKLEALLKAHPRGQNAIQLEHLGWRPETDGTLEEAKKAGVIVWVHGKWFAV